MQSTAGHSVVLVLGGVRSGKSRYAQQLAEQFGRVTFVATAERRDDAEMQRKIDRHRADRPSHWLTVEEPLALDLVIHAHQHSCDAMLVDCLTLFAGSLLEACGNDEATLATRIDLLCAALQEAACKVILVSNEVGSGVVPAYAVGRRFRDLVGELNQRVASVADSVLLMVAGLPLSLKNLNPGGPQ